MGTEKLLGCEIEKLEGCILYKGYKLSRSVIENILEDSIEYRNSYSKSTVTLKEKIKESFDDLLLSENQIDVELLQKEWFPVGEYDVFLSHSHKDIDDIEALAGYLTKEMGLRVFVDSFIWRYCDELLRKLNNEYNCIDSTTYRHLGANWCCTNVTLILNSALQEVINKSEVLFFYNSPNSITHEYKGAERSDSPWIYSEILISKVIEKRFPKRTELIRKGRIEVANESVGLSFSYPAITDHLEVLTKNQFDFWKIINDSDQARTKLKHPLDRLYLICQNIKEAL